MIVRVKGGKLEWHYKPTKESVNCQIRAYSPGTLAKHPDCVVANIWDADALCKVTWMEDGRQMGSMKQIRDKDPVPISNSCLTDHLYSCTPSAGARQVTIVFVNRFGEKYTENVDLRQQ